MDEAVEVVEDAAGFDGGVFLGHVHFFGAEELGEIGCLLPEAGFDVPAMAARG